MKRFVKVFSLIISLAMVAITFSACSKKVESTPVEPENFRITSYIVGDRCLDMDSFDTSHFDQLTDIIFFGMASFDENGQITLSDDFEQALSNIQGAMTGSQSLYLNINGPSSQSSSDDWNEQMDDLSIRNSNAFESGNLEGNIKDVLEKYGFDGVFFDYEFPLKSKYWKIFDSFILSLDSTLGDDYKIGMALAAWNANQSKKAIEATDMVEVMSYDLWDDDGNHATIDIAQDDIETMVKKGYDKSKLDLGVPFYARPTTKESYWYDYKSYYDELDEIGLFEDKNDTGLVFSFNTYDVINEKTTWAIDNGVGGIMVWHYSCDVPKNNDKSLFNAIYNAKQSAIENAG